jgi:hypothetical protein
MKSTKFGVASLQVWPRMVYRRSQYVVFREGLSKFKEVCKVSSKFDVASLQVWPRMVYRRSQYVMVRGGLSKFKEV